jgi:osmotically-inducible protein OsmY
LAVTAALAVAGCDRDAQDAVKQAGTEIKREAKEAGAQAKHTFREVGETTGQVLEDAAVTAKVKAALHAEKDVKSRDIDVETFQGKVVLKGRVPDQAQSQLAIKVARSVDGVKSVENRIAVN